eukprot:4666985-Amphidinium_carterae.3
MEVLAHVHREECRWLVGLHQFLLKAHSLRMATSRKACRPNCSLKHAHKLHCCCGLKDASLWLAEGRRTRISILCIQRGLRLASCIHWFMPQAQLRARSDFNAL